MKCPQFTLVLILAASSGVYAQEGPNAVYAQGPGPVVTIGMAGAFGRAAGAPVQGAPYSAAITNESVQTLADGNRIVQTSSGTTARDSQGRTRQDAPFPAIGNITIAGNLSAANAPRLVFIQDPVAQDAYTLDLTHKIAQKMPALAPGPGGPAGSVSTFFLQRNVDAASGNNLPPPMPPPMPLPPPVLLRKDAANDQAQVTTEDLGSQTIEGVLANGVRTTRTIPAGQIGNDKPIDIVTEVWTSPELKTIVYSKRSDPRMGEQTFRLTNIVRGEPDASLFAIPPDFKIVDGSQPVVFRSNQ